jgi:hypothetical protein
MEVVELVPCAHNKWGNWWEFWFYVSEGTVEYRHVLTLLRSVPAV